MRSAIFIILLQVCSISVSQVSDSTLFKTGIDLAKNNQYDSAKSFLLYAADSSDLQPLYKGQANFYLKNIFRSESNFEETFRRGDLALAQFQKDSSYSWLGSTQHSLCMDNLIAGSYDIALIQAQNAYSQFEKIADTSMMIQSMARRGIVFHDIGEYQEGIRVCEEADDLREVYSGKNADLQVDIWGIMAINYDDMGRSDLAVEMYKKILPLKDQLSSQRPIVRTYNNMGNSLMKLGRLSEAKKYIQLNLDANLEANFEYGIATSKTNLGTIAYKNGDFKKAERILNEAEEIAFKIQDAEKILDVLQQKFLMREFQNQDSDALSYLKRYHAVKDSLYSLDKQRQIRLLETQFETQRKEQQIAIQKAEIAEQEAAIDRNKILLTGSIITILLIISLALLQKSRLQKSRK